MAPALDTILPKETTAVLDYALAHLADGYRQLAWQMANAAVPYLSPSTVYRILGDIDLLDR